MQPFTTLTSRVIPLPRDDVNTDQIIPARYLKVIDKAGLAEGLFSEWRYRSDGSPALDFPFNQERYQSAQILLVGDNFGCGSSREHAIWALIGWGIRAVISTSFADIFRNNALKNCLLPVVVDERTHSELVAVLEASPSLEVRIDLPSQTLQWPKGSEISFPIDPFNKTCLLEGVDQLGYLLKHEAQIAAYEETAGSG